MAINDPMIGRQIGGYTLAAVLGQGGMGTVYRAQDAQGRDIALKVLRFDAIDDMREVQRFGREAELATRLDHPNIVSIYGSGRDEGFLFLAMELIEGESLRALLRRRGKLPLDEALSMAAQVLKALQAAHEQHIVHRDIKAENAIVDPDGSVKVLDFGVAKLEGGTALTRVNEILGTVEYMAPEQILGEAVGPAADLYATGVLLYEMLTGALPFSADSPATLVYHQLNEDPSSPSILNPAVPRALDRLVLRLLDKVPENRYGTALKTLEEVEEIRRRHQMTDIPGIDAVEEGKADEEDELRTRNFRPRFVGRQGEMEALMAPFEALGEGGRMVFVSGEPGIGKTRLLEEFARRSEARGGQALWGACFFEHGMGSYMPFLDALGQLFTENVLSETERESLADLLRERAPELEDLIDSGSTTAKVRAGFSAAFGSEDDPESARLRFFDTFFELLASAARMRPLAVVLEDMHWGDSGSFQLLHYLARRVSEAPILFLVSYRPEELAEAEGADLGAIRNQLDVDGLLQEVDLGRLVADEVAHMARSLFLEADFSDDFSEFLYAQSQGNPFIAIEVVKLLRQQNVLYCEDGLWSVRTDFSEAVIPERVNSLILQRIDQLDDDDRELLQLAAVIGQRFDSAVLGAAAGLSRIALLKALFKLEKNHRLIVSDNGSYEFSHSKLREVLYGEIPWELQREYHRMTAAILEEHRGEGREVEDGEMGYHFYHGEEFARAIPFLEKAGAEARRLFDWRRTAQLFDQVTEACRQSGASENLLEALRHSGRAYAQATAYEKATERFEEMRQTATGAESSLGEADARTQLAWVASMRGNFAQAAATYKEVLVLLEGVEDEEAERIGGRALLDLGLIDFEEGRYSVAEERWQKALAIMEEIAADEVGDALNNLAVLATVRGDLDGAWDLYERALQRAAAKEPSDQMVYLYHNMGMVRATQENWDEALELYEQSLAQCRQTRSVMHQPSIELNQAEARLGKGEIAVARAACSSALRGFRRLDDGLGVADALRLYGRICSQESNWDDGRAYLERSIELNRQFGETISLGEALYELGVLNRDAGSADDALEPLHEAERVFTQVEASLDLDRVRTVLEELEAA